MLHTNNRRWVHVFCIARLRHCTEAHELSYLREPYEANLLSRMGPNGGQLLLRNDFA